VIDADEIAREVQRPGTPVLRAMAERFGARVIATDGTLDRAAVAAVVFSDPEALDDLNRIVHPAIGREVNRRIEAELDRDHVVVLDIPLLAENPRDGLAATIVVDVPVETAVDRLVRFRGMDEADARARIGRQATREERLAKADRVIDNDGPPEALDEQIDDLWAWLQRLPPVPPGFQPSTPSPPSTA
jgi:dephospho-CoA kinase